MPTENIVAQIGRLNEEIDRHLRPPQFLSFKDSNTGNLRFGLAMRTKFSQCVGSLIPIPVDSHPDHSVNRLFVLEVDITPHSIFCEDFEFSHCFGGKVVTNMRQGSSNIKKENFKDQRGNDLFGKTLKENIKWRMKADMHDKREEISNALDLGNRSGARRELEDILYKVKLGSLGQQHAWVIEFVSDRQSPRDFGQSKSRGNLQFAQL